MKKESPVLSRREFVGTVIATLALPAAAGLPALSRASAGRPAPAHAPDSGAQETPKARTLEDERREALENMEKAVKPIREFRVRVETEPAFIFRARR